MRSFRKTAPAVYEDPRHASGKMIGSNFHRDHLFIEPCRVVQEHRFVRYRFKIGFHRFHHPARTSRIKKRKCLFHHRATEDTEKYFLSLAGHRFRGASGSRKRRRPENTVIGCIGNRLRCQTAHATWDPFFIPMRRSVSQRLTISACSAN